MIPILKHRCWTSILYLLCTALLLATLSESKNPNGVHSDKFDPKYKPPSDTLLTPLGQPGLFSFTGRWHRFKEVFKASVWPGTSLTVLSFGDHCTFSLKPRITGKTNLTYTVSVDDGPEFEVWKVIDLPDVAAGSIPLRIDTPARALASKSKNDENAKKPSSTTDGKLLNPHIVRIVSSRRTSPLSIEGIYISTAVVRQDRTWLNAEQSKPYVEFIGGPDHGDVSFAMNSIEWKAADELGYRHNHITTDTCVSSVCYRNVSLVAQYRMLNPMNHDPYHREGLTLESGRYSFHTNPILQRVTPNFVFVNVGDYDLAANVQGQDFADALYNLLAVVRFEAHPNAFIFVVAKKNRYYSETITVVNYINDPKMTVVPYPNKNTIGGWRKTLQKAVDSISRKDLQYRIADTLRDAAHSTTGVLSISNPSRNSSSVNDEWAVSHIITLFLLLLIFLAIFMLRDFLRLLIVSAFAKMGITADSIKSSDSTDKKPILSLSKPWE
ncbi:hypothetical protein V1511DRAFT_511692 [Dipodascopsis uninucleata]